VKRFEFGWRPDLLKGDLAGVLDHVRWVSALGVCLSHVRTLLFVDAQVAAPTSASVKLFYLLTLFGPEYVVLFFVTSGLLVGGGLVRRHREARLDLVDYGIDRLSRLAIVLFPALILSIGLYWAGLSVTCAGGVTIPQTLGNAALLQNIVVDPVCNNHPLWSLSNEAFYYVLAPAVLIALWRRSPVALACAGALFVVAILQARWSAPEQSLLFGAVIWGAGILPWFLRVRIPAFVGFSLLAIAMLLSRLHLLSPTPAAHGLIAACFVLTLCSTAAPAVLGGKLSRLGRNLAGFSYSLYLLHMPIAQTVRRLLGHSFQPEGWLPFMVFGATVVGIVLLSWLSGLVFENHTGHLRNLIRRLFRHRVHVAGA
jgi:peptidoglycan/LPS O-acetylase OafA/YrhL